MGADLILEAVFKLLDKIIPDPQKRDEMKLALRNADNSVYLQELSTALQIDQSQAAVNAEEAKNSNLFVSGPRSALEWVCVAAAVFQFVVQPVIIFGCSLFGRQIPIPAFDTATLVSVMLGLMGLNTLKLTMAGISGMLKK